MKIINGRGLKIFSRGEQITIGLAIVATLLSGILHNTDATLPTFLASAVALAFLANLISAGTEQLAMRLGPSATGILQAALGNLPELFFGIFALRKGAEYVPVVQAALVGSVLGNSLLVLGFACLIGGVRHGVQRFAVETPRSTATLTLLAVAALTVPTLADQLQTSASSHIEALSVVCAIVLLVVFICSIFSSLQSGPAHVVPEELDDTGHMWPIGFSIIFLLIVSAGAAFVSEWFVDALMPATEALHISAGFTGLIIVAVAGNAVEHVVGVQLMARNKPDYGISVILNSSMQIALALIPALVLLSYVTGGAHLTLVLAPLLLGSLFVASLIGAFVVNDGESTWLKGVALLGLYVIIATGYWW